MEVSVTVECLRNVKTALTEFQAQVEDVTSHVSKHGEAVVNDINKSLKCQHSLVETLIDKKRQLRIGIDECQMKITNISGFIHNKYLELQSTSSQISRLQIELAQLQRIKNSVSSQNSNQEGSDQADTIEKQIQRIEQQLSRLESEKVGIEEEISESEHTLSELKLAKIRLEKEYDTAKKELERAENKEERMKSSAREVEKLIQKLDSNVKDFEKHVITTNETSVSGVEKCIQFINEYDSVHMI